MRVYELREPARLRRRAYPWVDSEADSNYRSYDFLQHPELIRSSLEDFQAWRAYASTETFFQMIEWLNGPDGGLLSNDCAFSGPAQNEGPHSDRRLEASGRVMVLFRDLVLNTSMACIEGLRQHVAQALSQADPHFVDGIIGASNVDVDFMTLPNPPRVGKQLLLSFWAWGDDEAETMDHLDRTLKNLFGALKKASTA